MLQFRLLLLFQLTLLLCVGLAINAYSESWSQAFLLASIVLALLVLLKDKRSSVKCSVVGPGSIKFSVLHSATSIWHLVLRWTLDWTYKLACFVQTFIFYTLWSHRAALHWVSLRPTEQSQAEQMRPRSMLTYGGSN